MKQVMKQLAQPVFFVLLLCTISFLGCKKEIKTDDPSNQLEKANTPPHGHLKQTNTFSNDVAIAWMNMQIRLMRASGLGNTPLIRVYAYSGIALYESVVPGMPAFQSVASQLNGLSGLPETEHGFAYHWPSAANAALALMNKQIFPTASAANKAAIDSLENALKAQYQDDADAATINRSIAFGKAVAQKIFDWSETDGKKQYESDAYTPPVGDGLWVPTPPANAPAATPYWGKLRTIVPGSGNNSQPGPPPPYSTDPSSDFYKMEKQVYDVSQHLSPQDSAQALFWRDAPGTVPAHYLSILEQALQKANSTLDVAAYGWILGGIASLDASISCWIAKFHYNLVRPITYIRTVLGHPTWNALFATPAHPEYPSAHATITSAFGDAMTAVFGDNFSLTDHTYDFLGNIAPRTFSSFTALGDDGGNSRLPAGIHYQVSINTGLKQGRTVAQNIIASVKFIKE
jgi:hypothetical protein